MSQLQECPNCIKYNIGVTLMEKDGSMVCPVCESIYWELSFQKIIPRSLQKLDQFRQIRSKLSKTG